MKLQRQANQLNETKGMHLKIENSSRENTAEHRHEQQIENNSTDSTAKYRLQ